jgi:hypothetical protein
MVSPITAWVQTLGVTSGLSPSARLLFAIEQSMNKGTLQVECLGVSGPMFHPLGSNRVVHINDTAKRDPVHDNNALDALGDGFAEPVYGALLGLARPGTGHTTPWEEHDFLRAGNTVGFQATKIDHSTVRLEVDYKGGRREFNASLVKHGGGGGGGSRFVLSIEMVPS